MDYLDIVEELESEIDDTAAHCNAVAAETLACILEYLSQAAKLRGKAITARCTGFICEAARYEAQSEEAITRARLLANPETSRT
jgi:hypothetical protein